MTVELGMSLGLNVVLLIALFHAMNQGTDLANSCFALIDEVTRLRAELKEAKVSDSK